MNFGDLVKELRIAQKKTLRQFCLEHDHDPSNWSKMERSVKLPPREEKTLERWARQLGLKPGTEAWQDFMDRAAIAGGRIPHELLSDEKIIEKLPVFFRTIRGAELNEKELNNLIKKIKKVHQSDES